MTVDYGAESMVDDPYGEPFSIFYGDLVEMGGWDLDFFNRAVASFSSENRPDLVMNLMISFVNTEFEQIFEVNRFSSTNDNAEGMLRSLADEIRTKPFSVVSDFTNASDGFVDDGFVDARDDVIREMLESFAMEHTGQALRLDVDDIATIYTAGGCYRFEVPFVIQPRSILFQNDLPTAVRNMTFHLIRFQMNLFYSTMLLYLDKVNFRNPPSEFDELTVDDLEAIERILEDLRRQGEEP